MTSGTDAKLVLNLVKGSYIAVVSSTALSLDPFDLSITDTGVGGGVTCGSGKIISECDTATAQCLYRSPPADIANNISASADGKTWGRLYVYMNNNATQSSPVLYRWNVTYNCRPGE